VRHDDWLIAQVYLKRLSELRRRQMTTAAIGARVAALKDKLAQTYETIGTRTDELTHRLDNALARHGSAVNAQMAELDAIESGVAAVEALARQMTNGGPPLSGASTTMSKPDQNGVTLPTR
jgi:hypothetical protein